MRLLKLIVAVAVLLAATTTSAWAHVTVSAPGAARGGTDVAVTFRVPTESDTLRTTGVTLSLPTDTPIAGVSVAQVAGWTSKTTSTTLSKPITTDDGTVSDVVSEVTWTADAGAGIGPETFGEFRILAGLLPDADQIVFKVVQTYSDSSKVSWIDTQAPGSTAELEHPAPVLTLGSEAAATPTPTPGVTATASAAPKATSTTVPTTLSIVAIVLAVAALGLAVLRRRTA